MSTEKMREEFEAWILGLGYSTSRVSGGECREDYYAYRMTNMAWLAWQASRATLVVELPEPSPHIRYMDHRGAVETIMAQVRDALERQGVRVK